MAQTTRSRALLIAASAGAALGCLCTSLYLRRKFHIRKKSPLEKETAAGDDQTQLNTLLEFVNGPMNRIQPKIRRLFRANKPGSISRRYSKNNSHVVRIAITGGPCAGKSSSLAFLIKNLTAKGFDVYIVPECATILFNNGCKWQDNQPGFTINFQLNLMNLILSMERAFVRIAGQTGRPSILLCDRGIMDCKGFTTQLQWNECLDRLGKIATQSGDKYGHFTDEVLLARYDGVVHLTTAAKGAEEFYKSGMTIDDSGKQVFRRESVVEARAQDDRMLAAWRGHPRHCVVENEPDVPFPDKLKRVLSAVESIAFDIHPQTNT